MVLLKKTDYDAKITDKEGKIPDVSNLVTKTALITVENKIDDVNNLVYKTDYDTEIENKLNNHNLNKYITTPESCWCFSCKIGTSKFGEKKTDFDALLSSFNMRVFANTREILLAKDQLNKLKTFDSSYSIGKSHFNENGTWNYLVFQPLNKYFKLITNALSILLCQSKKLSTENIDSDSTLSVN